MAIDRYYAVSHYVSITMVFKYRKKAPRPITVAAQSKARSNTGIVGSNQARGLEVCLSFFCVCVLCR
jgi:hypothetical protein